MKCSRIYLSLFFMITHRPPFKMINFIAITNSYRYENQYGTRFSDTN